MSRHSELLAHDSQAAIEATHHALCDGERGEKIDRRPQRAEISGTQRQQPKQNSLFDRLLAPEEREYRNALGDVSAKGSAGGGYEAEMGFRQMRVAWLICFGVWVERPDIRVGLVFGQYA